MADALHAATAGVQDYQRVQILSAPDERIIGAAAADVVHLLTELVDNALNYSPPTAPVLVDDHHASPAHGDLDQRRRPRHRHRRRSPRSTATLTSGGEVTPDTARRMGLLVVSRLARRHGISVSAGAQRARRHHRHGDAAALDPLVRRDGRSDARARAGRRQPRRPWCPPWSRPHRTALPPRDARRAEAPGRGAATRSRPPSTPSSACRSASPARRSARRRPAWAARAGRCCSGSTLATPASEEQLATTRTRGHRPRRAPRRSSWSGTSRSPLERPDRAEPEPDPEPRAAERRRPSPWRQPAASRDDGHAYAAFRTAGPGRRAGHEPVEPEPCPSRSPGSRRGPSRRPSAVAELAAQVEPRRNVLDARDSRAEHRRGGRSPIFGSLRSNWLSADGDAAARRGPPPRSRPAGRRPTGSPRRRALQVSESGLPVRRPGGRLVPGGVVTPRPDGPSATPRPSGPGWPPTPPASPAAVRPPPPIPAPTASPEEAGQA